MEIVKFFISEKVLKRINSYLLECAITRKSSQEESSVVFWKSFRTSFALKYRSETEGSGSMMRVVLRKDGNSTTSSASAFVVVVVSSILEVKSPKNRRTCRQKRSSTFRTFWLQNNFTCSEDLLL